MKAVSTLRMFDMELPLICSASILSFIMAGVVVVLSLIVIRQARKIFTLKTNINHLHFLYEREVERNGEVERDRI